MTKKPPKQPQHNVHMHLPEILWAKLQKRAGKDNQTVTAVITEAVEIYLLPTLPTK